MSPQKTSIKDLDGLPAGEIDLRISQSEQRTREVIESRLTTQDERLDLMQNDITSLVGTQKITGLVQSVKATMDTLVQKQDAQAEKHEQWHEADLEYRQSMFTRVGTIETEQKKLGDQVRMIRWFVATSHGIGKCLAVGMKALTEADFWKVAGAAALMWVLSHFAPGLWKEVSEYIKK